MLFMHFKLVFHVTPRESSRTEIFLFSVKGEREREYKFCIIRRSLSLKKKKGSDNFPGGCTCSMCELLALRNLFQILILSY